MHFDFDCLITTVAADVETHVVSFLAQLAHRLVRNTALHFNVSAGSVHLFAGRFVVTFMLPAGRIPGFLNVQTKINLVCEHLYMTLRLHPAAHDTESFPRFAVFHYESRNNGVKWTFARRVNIRVLRIHREKLAAILKHESKTRYNDPAAHPAIIALDERHHVAFI